MNGETLYPMKLLPMYAGLPNPNPPVTVVQEPLCVLKYPAGMAVGLVWNGGSCCVVGLIAAITLNISGFVEAAVVENDPPYCRFIPLVQLF